MTTAFVQDTIPFQFVQGNNETIFSKNEYIEESLKNGEAMPVSPFHNDWTIGIIIFSVMLFSVVYASGKIHLSSIVSFFLFRGTKKEKQETTELFRWESAILNVSAIFLISIFAHFAISYSGIILFNLTGIQIWLFATGIIVVALILRHFICMAVGLISNTIEVFNGYIFTVYQAYKFAGFSLLIVMILFFYTPLIDAKNCFIIGCTVVAIIYLIRIIRLFLLFITHKISIFYLILYLCALEILPVLILIKYFSGLM